MNIKKITDLDEAKSVWEILSPKETIYDEWNFRYLYYSFSNYPIAFYVAFENNKPVALLPLQFNTDKGYAEFFGGGYFEDNKIFYEKVFDDFEELIKNISETFKLEWVSERYTQDFEISEYKYLLDLQGLNDKKDYINKFWSGKSKQNLNAQIRKLQNRVKVEYNKYEDFYKLVELNQKRFGKNSSFNFPFRVEYFKKLLNESDCLMISIYVDGKIESVGFSVLYKGIYYGLNSGTNNEIDGLGKYLILEKIDQAIKEGAKLYDARAENLGWKEAFKFSKRPQYDLDLTNSK